ncbi:MAG: glycosyltransferase [Planctomycetaceae bacterium]
MSQSAVNALAAQSPSPAATERRPHVSVVIPTYNYGRFVRGAVESVLAQTFRDFEVIVVDDGSRDDTRERLAPLSDEIRYVYQENSGLSAARNRGIAEARGEFVALLDSDDEWHPRFLECVMREFAREPAFQMLAGGSFRASERAWRDFDDRAISAADVPLASLLTYHPICPSAVVMRHDALDAAGPFDTSLRSVEDRDMWIRIALAGRVGCLNTPLVWIRDHAGSMSSAANAERMEMFDRLVLRRAFDREELKRQGKLRRQVLSIADWRAAVGYREAGAYGRAWGRTLSSLWLWPLAYTLPMTCTQKLFRLRFLACLLQAPVRSLFRRAPQGQSP